MDFRKQEDWVGVLGKGGQPEWLIFVPMTRTPGAMSVNMLCNCKREFPDGIEATDKKTLREKDGVALSSWA